MYDFVYHSLREGSSCRSIYHDSGVKVVSKYQYTPRRVMFSSTPCDLISVSANSRTFDLILAVLPQLVQLKSEKQHGGVAVVVAVSQLQACLPFGRLPRLEAAIGRPRDIVVLAL